MERAGKLAKTHGYPLLVTSGVRKERPLQNDGHMGGQKDNKHNAMLHHALATQLRSK